LRYTMRCKSVRSDTFAARGFWQKNRGRGSPRASQDAFGLVEKRPDDAFPPEERVGILGYPGRETAPGLIVVLRPSEDYELADGRELFLAAVLDTLIPAYEIENLGRLKHG